MENWIVDMMEQFGYVGIMLLIALENLFPPIPSEVILTFGGFMTTYSRMSVIGVIAFATIGSVAGAIILYYIGSLLGLHRIERLINRYGHFIRLNKKDLHRAFNWFERYGPWTVFFCRLVPLIRSLISIPAGMTKMNFGLFVVLTTLGSLIWNTVLVTVGSVVGESWGAIVQYMSLYSNIVYIALAALILFFLIFFLLRRR
ncbi:hypothetical protein BTS2_1397 [Bacillus sp. TS-2]|nr:hypothetical protein BTS2_1397 [Bacillus sp. TS-2]